MDNNRRQRIPTIKFDPSITKKIKKQRKIVYLKQVNYVGKYGFARLTIVDLKN